MKINFGWRSKGDKFFESFLPNFQAAPQLCAGFSELEIAGIFVLMELKQARFHISSCQIYGVAVTPNDRGVNFQSISILCNIPSRNKSI